MTLKELHERNSSIIALLATVLHDCTNPDYDHNAESVAFRFTVRLLYTEYVDLIGKVQIELDRLNRGCAQNSGVSRTAQYAKAAE
jgi:hypothetical protein